MNKQWIVVSLLIFTLNGLLASSLIATHRKWTDLNQTEVFDLEITHLDVSYNGIAKIEPGLFRYHDLLEVLRLNYNRKFDFQRNEPFLRHARLEMFECEGCGVTAIYAETFAGLPALRHLSLGRNIIATIDPDAFKSNHRLTSIDLQANHFQTLNPEVFSMSINLKLINLSDNPHLSFEPDKYLNSVNLEEISLENCNVISIKVQTFASIPNLKSLNLNRNKIKSIDKGAFVGVEKLEQLHLERNQLTSFNSELLAPLERLQVLCLDGNPLVKDEQLQKVMANQELRSGCTAFEATEPNLMAKEDQGHFEIRGEDIILVRSKQWLQVFIGSYMALVLIVEVISIALLIYCLGRYLKSLEMNENLHDD